MKTYQPKIRYTILGIAVFLFSTLSYSQTDKNLAELLGYPRDAKLLIIHADDMGMSQSVNAATIKAFESRGITSASIMVPCPWANDVLAYSRDNPGLDVGIHLTMTAEWNYYKWDGLTPSDQIRSLLDKNGYFYSSVEELGRTARGDEAEKEMKAQIDRVLSMGVKPTHIDTHMGSVLANPELTGAYLKLSEEYKLPVLFPRQYLSMLPPEAGKMMGSKLFILDNLFMVEPPMVGAKWIDAYKKAIEGIKPGLNQIIVHVGIDNDELKAITKGHPDYNSAWRQKDLDLVTSKAFIDLIKKNNIILIGWKQVRDVMNKIQ
jgi:hypothetical protein